MIQNCLIRREMAKKKFRRQTAVFGGSCGTAAVFSVFRVATFNSKNLKKKITKHYVSRVLPYKQPKKRLTAEPIAVSRYFFKKKII